MHTIMLESAKLGNLQLKHRFALSPMTRSRAHPDGTPGLWTADYYSQRAGLGLLITEGIQPSDDGQGYLNSPGIYTKDHIQGWKKVTDAVHEAGGRIFFQLMHAGRMSHPDNTPHHRQPVAPSAVGSGQTITTPTGHQTTAEPRALTTEEVKETVQDYRKAAAAAIEAGADGVELHGANGYLIHQFFAPNANQRTDFYGGSIENRARFALEVAQAVAEEIGSDRTGIRLSPGAPIGGLVEGPEAGELYSYLVRELAKLDLAYIHLFHFGNDELLKTLRAAWPRTLLLVRKDRTLENLHDDVVSGLADIIPIGTLALANPDFVERYRDGAPMNQADRTTFFRGGEKGYIDYPTLEASGWK
jgi:2,4-dienoyl-CoA reductase-like NADH-dependent reductase (Old Yellow Enzyme family)